MLLYIHIPFCDSKCFYCAFNSYTSMHSLKQSYMKALKMQLEYELKKQNKQVETIFIGGGTPSCIDASEYKKILDIIQPYIYDKIEITIEANPNSATLDWQKEIYKLGINRISFGVQSFDDDKLKFLGRNHSKKEAIQAIQNAHQIGFENINIDIIYDTVKDNKELINSDLNIIKTLPVNHISAYSLTLEEGTKFYNKSNVQIQNIDLAYYLFEQLEKLGFKQYEISNFAITSQARSKHNLGYWKYKEYLGVGCGAVGCIDNKRYYNINDIPKYIQTPTKYEDIETLSYDDIKIEKLLLGFRSIVGVNISLFNSDDMLKVEQLVKQKKGYIQNNRLFSFNFMIADELTLFF